MNIIEGKRMRQMSQSGKVDEDNVKEQKDCQLAPGLYIVRDEIIYKTYRIWRVKLISSTRS